MSDLAEQKRRFRKQAIARRETLSPEQRQDFSLAACNRLLTLDLYRNAGAIHAFVPFGSEIDTRPIIEQAWADGKTVVFPVTDRKNDTLIHRAAQNWEQFTPGYAGILEPSGACPEFPLGDLDLILVPGMAYDRQGYRMGYGGGYYDRFLPQTRAVTVGLAFNVQLVDEVPREVHDLPVMLLITETETIEIDRNR